MINDDLVKRLRDRYYQSDDSIFTEAAAEIERLEGELANAIHRLNAPRLHAMQALDKANG